MRSRMISNRGSRDERLAAATSSPAVERDLASNSSVAWDADEPVFAVCSKPETCENVFVA